MLRSLHGFIHRWRADQAGSPAVEFAIAAPIVLWMLLGVIDFGLVMRAKSEMEMAARAGVQKGIGNIWDNNAIINAARGAFETSNIDVNDINVVPTQACYCNNVAQLPCTLAAANNLFCASGPPAYYLTVNVSRPYDMMMEYYLFPSNFSLSGTTTVRGERAN
jgi:Flp pilus assembly protein TadG